MKSFAPRIIAAVVFVCSLLTGIAWGGANVFLYHRFDEPRYSSTNIAVSVFAKQLAYLQDNNYRVLSLKEIVRRLKLGEALPEKCAALSVDDSYNSFKENAMPLLRKYSARAALLSGMACVHVMFDDGADKARRKVVDRLAQDCFVRSVILPTDEDPASVDVGYIVGKVPEFAG